jgi:hypothetical protein
MMRVYRVSHMAERAEPELRIKIRFHGDGGAEGHAPVPIRVHKDGVVEIDGRERVEPGGRMRSDAWTIAVERSDRPWSGPELLLIPPNGEVAGRMRCPLPEQVGTTVLLGRSAKACDIMVHDDHVSRVHLKITLTENGFSASDMQSKWGTLFNGRPMKDTTLLGHGDELLIGSTIVRFLTRWDEAASRAPRPVEEGDDSLFETAETQAGPPPSSSGGSGGLSWAGGVKSPSSPKGRTMPPPSGPPRGTIRTAVPPLWLGIGIGMMIAIVGIVVWTLVSVLWPGG